MCQIYQAYEGMQIPITFFSATSIAPCELDWWIRLNLYYFRVLMQFLIMVNLLLCLLSEALTQGHANATWRYYIRTLAINKIKNKGTSYSLVKVLSSFKVP